MLALKRARLVGGAMDKITKLEEYIQPIHDKHLLVYCGATTILQEDQDYSIHPRKNSPSTQLLNYSGISWYG